MSTNRCLRPFSTFCSSAGKLAIRLAILLASGAPALAETPAPISLALSGRLAKPHSLLLADLSALPKLPAGPQAAGVLLWPLLDQSGWVDLPGRKTHLQHVILARGRDGYAVALSIAELDSARRQAGDPGHRTQRQAGRPADLFVPGDKHAARRVHDLVGIEVQ